jgi:hypothetical protein
VLLYILLGLEMLELNEIKQLELELKSFVLFRVEQHDQPHSLESHPLLLGVEWLANKFFKSLAILDLHFFWLIPNELELLLEKVDFLHQDARKLGRRDFFLLDFSDETLILIWTKYFKIFSFKA